MISQVGYHLAISELWGLVAKVRTLGFLGGNPVDLHLWSVRVPWLGIGDGSRVPMGSHGLTGS